MTAITGSIFRPDRARRVGPRTTVICAVWHRDPERRQLLRGHQANLDKQSVPVERVYVFDGGDAPPADLAGRVLVSSEALTIYQAWNLALATVTTPYVMNLNLDDRLCTDAIERLERAADQGADLVGGDWLNCFSQEDTDATGPSFAADGIPLQKGVPPLPNVRSRSGTGTGENHQYGHACLWRMALHQRWARYPMTFGDGTAVRIFGDTIWWRALEFAKREIVRVPLIIGHYHSHPDGQAEFRHDPRRERELWRRFGVRTV